MKLAILLVLLANVALVVACDRQAKPTPTITARPVQDPTVTVAPVPSAPAGSSAAATALPLGIRGVVAAAGLAVMRTGRSGTVQQLIMVSLSKPAQAQVVITEGASYLRYVGATRENGAFTLYWIAAQNDYSSGSLFRQHLGGTDPSKEVTLDHLAGSAAITADGTRLAYSASGGLYVRDLSTGGERLVVTNKSDVTKPGQPARCAAIEGDPTDWCWRAGDPAWSADGRYLLFHQDGWETCTPKILGPLLGAQLQWNLQYWSPPNIGEIGNDCDGLRSWSNEGVLICAASTQARPVNPSLLDASTRSVTAMPEHPAGSDGVSSGRCLWSSNGLLAAHYWVHQGGADSGVVIARPDRTPLTPLMLTPGSPRIWLPDASGVVGKVENQPRSAPPYQYFLARTDGTVWYLDLPDAELLDIIPEVSPP